MKGAFVVSLVALLLGSNALAETLITFDNSPDGTVINTHYATAGVTFDRQPGGGPVYARLGWVSVFGTGPWTAFNEQDGLVLVRFSTPQRWVTIDARPQVPFEPPLHDPMDNRPFLQGFDVFGHWLGTVYYAGPLPTGVCEVGPTETLTFMSENAEISGVVFSAEGHGCIGGDFDNLRFGTEQASNDRCSSAIPLTPGSTETVDTTHATSVGDPTPTCQASVGKGVWFTYTPRHDGPVMVITRGSTFNTVLQVYAGGCDALIPVTCNDDNGPDAPGQQASVIFAGTGGTTYRILACGYNGEGGTLKLTALLENDRCATAIPLTQADSYHSMDITGATSISDPVGGMGVWFTYTAVGDGPVLVSTCDSGYDTTLHVYRGDCASLTLVKHTWDNDASPFCSAPAPGAFLASLVFAAEAGATYYILVTGNYHPGTQNDLEIRVEYLANDRCEGAVALEIDTPYSVDTTFATSADDPNLWGPCQMRLGNGVWFTYTAEQSGALRISTCGSDFDTALALYEDTRYPYCDWPTVIACNDDDPACPGHQAHLVFEGVARATYRILVGGKDGASGSLQITAGSAVPANDQCAGAIALVPGVPRTMDTAYATSTSDPSPPCLYDEEFGKGVWFNYTATENAPVLLSTCGSGFNTVLQVYTGSCGALTPLVGGCAYEDGPACSGPWASLILDGVAGTTYRILAGGYQGASGALRIVAQLANDQCDQAVALSSGVASRVNTTDATSGGEPAELCQQPFGKGVWFKYTPSEKGWVAVNTCGSDFETIMQVFTGPCDSLVPVACDAGGGDGCPDGRAALAFQGTAGTTYSILVGGRGGASGNLSIVAGSVTERTLTVRSFPYNGVDIGVAPPDLLRDVGGRTPIARTYAQGTAVSLVAPGVAVGGWTFEKWRRNGADVSTSPSFPFTVETDEELLAVYVLPPPRIVRQPEGTMVDAGETVVLRVVAEATSLLTYQWQRNGQALEDATNPTLTLTDVTPADAGDFQVIVSNVRHEVPSAVAKLEVVPALGLALDTTNVVWRTGGGLGWYRQTDSSHDGADAATCVPLRTFPPTPIWMDTTVNGPGTLTFYWRYPADRITTDYLAYTIDGGSERQLQSSSWTKATNYLGSGSHVLRWSHQRQGAVPGGPAQVDEVRFALGMTRPRIAVRPVSQTVTVGGSATLTVVAEGTPPLSYQWRHDGVVIPQAHESALTLTGVNSQEAGEYSVIVSNAAGSAKAKAVVTVLVPPPPPVSRWKNPQGGLWSDPANWNPPGVPRAQDHAEVTMPGAAVQIDTDCTVAALTLNAQLVGPGTLAIAGPLCWTGGTIRSGVECSGGTIVGHCQLAGGRLINRGALRIDFLPGVNFLTGSGSVISNLAGASLDLATDGGLYALSSSSPYGRIENLGHIRKVGGEGSVSLDDQVHNRGTVEVLAGTLTLSRGGTGGGAYLAEGTATLQFGGTGGLHQLAAESRFTGAGRIVVGPGTAVEMAGHCDLDGTLAVDAAGILDIQSSGVATVGMLEVAGGTLMGEGLVTCAGPLDWRGGTIRGTVQCQGGNVGTSSTTLQGQLINTGTLTVSTPLGYAFYTGNGSVLSNLAGATLAWNTDVGTTHSGGVRGTISNEGRFQKSQGAGTTVITDHFQSSGVVQVDSGILSLATTSVLSGRCEANGTAILGFPSGTHTLAGCTLGGSGMIRFSGATIDIDGPTSGEAGVVVRLTAGEVTDDCPVDCHLTLAGALDWRGGKISGTVECQGGTVGGGSTSLSGGRLINTGTLTVSTPLGYGFYTGNGSVISNLAGATIAWNTDVGTTYSGGTPGIIDNQGRFCREMGAGTAVIRETFYNRPTGSLEVESGALSLRNGGINSGDNRALGSAILDFGGGTHTLDSSARLSGDGTIGCSGGTLEFRGSSASTVRGLVNGGTFRSERCPECGPTPVFGVLTVSAGSVCGDREVSAGTLDWRGGTLSGTVRCQGGNVGTSSTTLQGQLINTGTLTVSTPTGYAFYTGNGSVISNLTGATLVWNTDVGTTYSGGTRGIIDNQGRFCREMGSGAVAIGDEFRNQDGGTLQVDSGTLSLVTASTLHGRCEANGTAILDFPSGTHTLAGCTLGGSGMIRFSGARIDIDGPTSGEAGVVVRFTAGEVTDDCPVDCHLTLAGALDWRGGTIKGKIQCAGGTVGVGSTTLSGGLLINTGTLVVSTPLGYAFYTGNGSAIDNSPGATLAWHTDVGTTHLGGDRGTIHNAGRFQKDLSAGTTIINDTFNNVGTVEARSGTLSLTQPYLQTAGATRLLGGRLLVSAGMTLNGGVLTGTSTVVGKVVSRGIVSPGASPGLLTIDGDYTQLAEGLLEIELGGTTVGTGYDRLDVTGATALDGTLKIAVVNGFEPPPDTVFEFLTMSSNRGDFETIECPTCPSGSTTSFSDTGAALITGPAEDAPQLTITRAAPDVVVLSWPRQAEGWVLEHTDEMPGAPGPWPPVQQPYQTNDTAISVSYLFAPGSGNVFFRLRKGPAQVGPAAP